MVTKPIAALLMLWISSALPALGQTTQPKWQTAQKIFADLVGAMGNGRTPPELILVSDADGYPGLAPVGSFPSGATSHGALDLAGMSGSGSTQLRDNASACAVAHFLTTRLTCRPHTPTGPTPVSVLTMSAFAVRADDVRSRLF